MDKPHDDKVQEQTVDSCDTDQRKDYEAPEVISMSASAMGSLSGTGCVDAAPGVSCPIT